MDYQPSFIDMTGKTVGRWSVIAHAGYTKRGSATWQCVCQCGASKVVTGHELRSGRSSSCGCLKTEQFVKRNTTHGNAQRGKRTPSYRSWHHIIQRCCNPKNPAWRYYGGRGIKVCDRWRSYENFVADMGEPPAKHGIERLDVDGNYEPGNCIWADHKTQMNNTTRTRRLRAAKELA